MDEGALIGFLYHALRHVGFIGAAATLLAAVALFLSIRALLRRAGPGAFQLALLLAFVALIIAVGNSVSWCIHLAGVIERLGDNAITKDLGTLNARGSAYVTSWLALPAQLLALHGLLRPPRRRNAEVRA